MVEKSFHRIEDFVAENLERIDIDKYNIAIGLINDIVEMYGMKVVIICNSEILGEKFVHDILRSKLNCIEYRKIVSSSARISIIDNCLKDKVFEEQEKQDRIKEYLNKYIKSNMADIVLERQFDNLRLFGGLLEAFIILTDIFDKKDLTNEFLNSLFNSIMITHNAFYNKKLGCLSEFPTGANIEFLARLYYGTSPRLIRVGQGMEDTKWVDVAASGYWILNLSFPSESGEIVERWKNYKYNRTEMLICKNRNNLMSTQEYNLLHIFYFQKTEDIHQKGGWDCSSFVDNALKEYDLQQIEVVQRIIDSMGEVFHGRIYQGFFIYLFDKLIQGHENENIIGNTYIHDMYNNFRVKRELH